MNLVRNGYSTSDVTGTTQRATTSTTTPPPTTTTTTAATVRHHRAAGNGRWIVLIGAVVEQNRRINSVRNRQPQLEGAILLDIGAGPQNFSSGLLRPHRRGSHHPQQPSASAPSADINPQPHDDVSSAGDPLSYSGRRRNPGRFEDSRKPIQHLERPQPAIQRHPEENASGRGAQTIRTSQQPEGIPGRRLQRQRRFLPPGGQNRPQTATQTQQAAPLHRRKHRRKHCRKRAARRGNDNNPHSPRPFRRRGGRRN